MDGWRLEPRVEGPLDLITQQVGLDLFTRQREYYKRGSGSELSFNQSKPDLEGGEDVHVLVGEGAWPHFKGCKCKEGIVCRCLRPFVLLQWST